MSVISAEFIGRRVGEPLKMTSAISLPRRLLTLCSPSTHLMASTTFDLPEPFGPDDDRDPGWKFEPRLVGEALEAGEFQRLEHD